MLPSAGDPACGWKGMLSEDEVLVKRCQAEDEAAFDALFERHLDRVYALVCHYVPDREEARDITQEVFVRVYTHIHSFRGESAFTTWLYRVTVNVCLEHRRKSARRTDRAAFVPIAVVDYALEAEEEGPVDHLMRRDTEAKVRQAMESLPETHRVAVSLRYFEGLSCKEIAEILDCPVGTVNSRLHYAMGKLKAVLQGQLAE